MAAVAHHYSFSYLPYQRPDSNPHWCRAFLAMWDVSDVGRDIQEHLGIVGMFCRRFCVFNVNFLVIRELDKQKNKRKEYVYNTQRG